MAEQIISRMRECHKEKNFHQVIIHYKQLTHVSGYILSSTLGLALEAMLELDLKHLFLEEFRRMKNRILPNTYILTLVIELYIRDQDFVSAMALLETMKKFPHSQPNIITFNTLLKVGQKRYGSNIKGMEQVWQSMKSEGIKPNRWSFNILLESYTGVKDFDKAKEVIKECALLGFPPDIVTYNLLVKHELQIRGISGALIFLRNMKSADHQRDELTYYPLLKHAVVNKDDLLFRRLTEIMIDDKIEFTMTTFNLFLLKILQSNNLIQLPKLFRHLEKRNLKVNRDTYRHFLMYFRRTDPQKYTYAHLHLHHLNRLQSVLNPSMLSRITNNIYRNSRLDANQTSPQTRLIKDSCSHFLDCRNLAQNGQLDLAFEKFNEHIEAGYLPNAQQCSTIIHYALEQKYKTLATHVFDIYEKSHEVGIVILTSFIKFTENLGEVEAIQSYIEKRNVEMDQYAIACLGSKLIIFGNPELGVKLLENWKDKNVEIWNTLLCGYFALGKLAKMPECLCEIVQIDDKVPKPVMRAIRKMVQETSQKDPRRAFLLNLYMKALEINERPKRLADRLTKLEILEFINENVDLEYSKYRNKRQNEKERRRDTGI